MTQGLCILGNGPLAEAIRVGTENLTQFPPASLAAAQIIWCAHDTPISTEGIADADQVLEWLRADLTRNKHAWVLLSSQLPIGTCAWLEKFYGEHQFIVVPENIRVTHNIQDWLHQPRIIAGYRAGTDTFPRNIERILRQFTDELIIMDPESAEMVKHALNGFLALSVAYGNEIGQLCRELDADPDAVARGVMSDPRIGHKAYLYPGGPYGQHLAREINTLIALGGGQLIQAIKNSNDNQEATNGDTA